MSNKRYSDPHQMPYISTSVDLEAMLETQIKANLALTESLSEKDKLIHSLAHDLIDASEDFECYDGSNQAEIYKNIAQSALDSITDKGEKDE